MQPNDLQEHIRSTYHLLRVGLGLLAFFFPLLLLGFGYREGISIQGELSAYYWAFESNLRQFPLRGLFVGVLWAIGCFLILYKGFSRTENRILNIAGFSGLVVAICPMYTEHLDYCHPSEADKHICGPDALSYLHRPFAIILFVCMAVVAWACSEETLGELKKRNEQEPKDKKLWWWQNENTLRKWYYGLAAVMIATPVGVGLLEYVGLIQYNSILFIEWVGICAFAFYWLLKTYELRRSDADRKAMETKPLAGIWAIAFSELRRIDADKKATNGAPAKTVPEPAPEPGQMMKKMREDVLALHEDLRKRASRSLEYPPDWWRSLLPSRQNPT